MAGTADVLVWGDDVRVVADFLHRASGQVDKFRLKLTRDISPKIKAVVFLYKNDESLPKVQKKSNEVFVKKFIVKVLEPGANDGIVQSSVVAFGGERIGNIALDLTQPDNLIDFFEYVSKSLEKKYKIWMFYLSQRGLNVVKWISFTSSLISALLAILIIFLAGIISISRESTEQRWFANSLLTSGNLTFVMSFVGFYGVKKTGVKEYLKIYSGVLLLNAIYKSVLLIAYFIIVWNAQIESILIPVMGISVAFEVITSCIIFLELSVVKKAHNIT